MNQLPPSFDAWLTNKPEAAPCTNCGHDFEEHMRRYKDRHRNACEECGCNQYEDEPAGPDPDAAYDRLREERRR